jgi:hypothetical protein
MEIASDTSGLQGAAGVTTISAGDVPASTAALTVTEQTNLQSDTTQLLELA